MTDYVSRMLEIQAEHERAEREDHRRAMGGFVDPNEREERRVDRLERLIAEILPTLSLDALSPEARELLAEVESGNVHRLHRLHRHLAADPLLPEVRDPAAVAAREHVSTSEVE